MLIVKKYDNDSKIEECFYDSSNILYSKCIDNENAYKDLYVTFNKGKTYHYFGVTVQDYLLFRNAESQGKALNKYILPSILGKKKYDFEKIEDLNLDSLMEQKNKLINEEKDINNITDNSLNLVNRYG